VVVGKQKTKGSNDFQVSKKVPLFASGRRRKMPRADEGRRWKEWEIGVGNFSLVSHTGREKGESDRDGNASARTKMLVLLFTRYSKRYAEKCPYP
jgi:hypothetical protein